MRPAPSGARSRGPSNYLFDSAEARMIWKIVFIVVLAWFLITTIPIVFWVSLYWLMGIIDRHVARSKGLPHA
jgi:MFS-type transporter involved in bile tolerance (Atg22 family)